MKQFQRSLYSGFIAPVILYISITCILHPALAQTNNTITDNTIKNTYGQVSIASPTAGSLGKYADIPVNYHTGIPQINIPVYTVKAGSLSLPISLSYHASGLKVMEPASWVGAGWALNAGGVITRTVMGAPDERGTNNSATETNGHFSDYGFSNYMYQGTNPPTQPTTPQDWQQFASGVKDGEPDLYFFNFNGYSGKFYFNDDRTPVIVPEEDFRIVPAYTGSGSIQSFDITTPDGTKYSFGNSPGISGAAPIEITNPVTVQNGAANGTVISSWFLNRISSADNQFAINLSYTQENYGYFTIAMFPVDGNATGSTYEYNLTKNVVQGVRLNAITCLGDSIKFIPGAARTDLSDAATSMTDNVNTQAAALGSIQIKNDNLCKNFTFYYSSFYDNTSPLNGIGITSMNYNLTTDKLRLKLDSMKESSCDNALTVPAYRFSYFDGVPPRRLTFGQDHWGFYNGVTNNGTLIPTYTVVGSNGTNKYIGATRDAAFPAMRNGTLQKIIYPTGGYTSFDYEPNEVFISHDTLENMLLKSWAIHISGYSGLSMTASFTLSGGGAYQLNIFNSSNYGVYFDIANSSGANVYSSPIIPKSSDTAHIVPKPNNIFLPDGNYTGRLYSSGSDPNLVTGSAEANFMQWQHVLIAQNVLSGGLRIKTIAHNDGNTTNDMVTSYSYRLPGGNSTGILFSVPAYVGLVRNDLIKNTGYWSPTNGFTPYGSGNGCPSVWDANFFKSPCSIRPMGTTQGYHMGYSRVKVTQTGNGYSFYDYYGSYNGNYSMQGNSSNVAITQVNTAGCDANAPNYPAAPLPFEFTRGALQHEWHYNDAGQLLEDIAYTPTYTPTPVTTPGFMVVYRGGQLLGTNYTLQNQRKTKMVTVKTESAPGTGSVSTTTTDIYGSTFHHEPSSHTVVLTTGESLVTNLKYAWDFRVANCDAIADGWASYQANCSSCQTAFNKSRDSCNGSSSCLTTAYLRYTQCTLKMRMDYVSYRRSNFTDPGNLFQARHDYAKNNQADSLLKPILELQDEYKNPVIETSNFKNTNLTNASLIWFTYGINETAFVYPGRLQALYPSTLATTFSNAAVSGTSVAADGRYADEAFYKFDKGNPVEATGKDGVTTSYLWGYNNTLPIAKAVGTDYATLSAAYTAAGGNLTSLRSQSSLSGAQLSTYTYLPLLGMTGQTDASGKSVTYEYDKLGRLANIKDQNGYVIKKYDYKYTGQ